MIEVSVTFKVRVHTDDPAEAKFHVDELVNSDDTTLESFLGREPVVAITGQSVS